MSSLLPDSFHCGLMHGMLVFFSPTHTDQDDHFIDFDLEALSSHLTWEDDSISSTSRWGRSSESEKVPPPRQVQQSPSPHPQEPQMDLEADFPISKDCEVHHIQFSYNILWLLICYWLAFNSREVRAFGTLHARRQARIYHQAQNTQEESWLFLSEKTSMYITGSFFIMITLHHSSNMTHLPLTFTPTFIQVLHVSIYLLMYSFESSVYDVCKRRPVNTQKLLSHQQLMFLTWLKCTLNTAFRPGRAGYAGGKHSLI